MRALARPVVALLVTLALAVPAGGAKPDGKSAKTDARAASPAELEALRGRIAKLQRELTAAESTRSEAADQLRESEKSVSEAHRALFGLAQRAKALQAELDGIAARESEPR